MYKPDESLWWDGKVLDIDTNGNYPAYSTCAYFSNDNNERRLRQKIKKSSDGLFRYQNRVVIPRSISALINA